MSRQLDKAKARWRKQSALRWARTRPKRSGMGDVGFTAAFLAPMVVIGALMYLGTRRPTRRGR